MEESDSDTIPIEQNILDVLDESKVQMSEQTKQNLVDFMVEMGTFSVKDMMYISDEDLAPFLLPIQRRKLLSCIHLKFNNNKIQDIFSDQNSDVQAIQVSSRKDDSPVPQFNAAIDYKINEEKLPISIVTCLQEKKRLSPSERRLLVRIMSDDILMKFKYPGRKILRIIANNLVLKYPKSLADYGFNQEFLGDGCGSFILQLENSLSNSRRHGQKRLAESSASESEPSTSRKKQGCNLSQDELESLRVTLVAKFQTLGSVDEEAISLLQRSFTGVRSQINSQKFQVSALLKGWPILFTKIGLSVHFEQLVGKSLKNFTDNLCKTMSNFQMYMQSLQIKNKGIKTVIKEINAAKSVTKDSQPKVIGMLTLLTHYFGEHINALVLKEGVSSLLVTLCIISKGSTIYTGNGYDIAVDKQIIIKDVGMAADALAILFASFYIFNIQYPSMCAVTLEFLQWSIAEIRPTGNKLEKAGRNKSRMNGIHAKVTTLVNNINDFCAL